MEWTTKRTFIDSSKKLGHLSPLVRQFQNILMAWRILSGLQRLQPLCDYRAVLCNQFKDIIPSCATYLEASAAAPPACRLPPLLLPPGTGEGLSSLGSA